MIIFSLLHSDSRASMCVHKNTLWNLSISPFEFRSPNRYQTQSAWSHQHTSALAPPGSNNSRRQNPEGPVRTQLPQVPLLPSPTVSSLSTRTHLCPLLEQRTVYSTLVGMLRLWPISFCKQPIHRHCSPCGPSRAPPRQTHLVKRPSKSWTKHLSNRILI